MFKCIGRITHNTVKYASVMLAVVIAVSSVPTLSRSYAASCSVSECTVDGVPSFFVYTGNEISPRPIVSCNGNVLTESIDYTVSCTDNVNVGTATAVITGTGSFSGSKTLTFEITPRPISDAVITLIKTKATYRGSEIRPAVSVKLGGKALNEGTDYTLSYSSNINIGTAEVKISGTGNFSGTETRSFTITPHSIENAELSFSADKFTYTGSEIKPVVYVSQGKNTLVEGTDYTLAFSNNINVGTASVTVKGKGNYSGASDKSFEIEKRDISTAKITIDTAVSGCPETVTLDNIALKKNTDYTLSSKYENGTLTVTAEGMGNYCGAISACVQTELGDKLTVLLEEDTYVYTSAIITPKLTVYCADVQLQSEDYTLNISDGINVGTASVTVSGKGIYSDLSGSAEFLIVPASLEECTASCEDQQYTGATIMPIPDISYGSYDLINKTDFVVTLYSNCREVGTGTMTVVGTGNFKDKITIEFKIFENDSSAMENKVKAKLDDMMNGLCDRQINAYVHSYKLGNYYNTMLYSPCVCHSFCMDGTEADCTCLIGRSTVLNNYGIQCAGFTFEVFEYLFGGTNSAGGNKLTIKGKSTSGWSESMLRSWAQTFKPGDYLAYTNVSYGYDHYVTVYSVDSDGIWVYEANYGGRCKINFRKFYFSEMYSQCDDFWHRTPVNYILSE